MEQTLPDKAFIVLARELHTTLLYALEDLYTRPTRTLADAAELDEG